MRFKLSKSSRLLKSEDFKKVIFNYDRVVRCNEYSCYIKENSLDHSRIGISVTKKVGKAVIRNRYKRYVREFFRLKHKSLPRGKDFIVVIKKYKQNFDHSYFSKSSSRFTEITDFL